MKEPIALAPRCACEWFEDGDEFSVNWFRRTNPNCPRHGRVVIHAAIWESQ